MLANRLKIIFPKLVFKDQSAFVLGQSILDSVLIAYKLINYLENKTKGKT